jgi:hypothetical protein
MENIKPLPRRAVSDFSQTLVIIPQYLRNTQSRYAQTFYERVHIDVLRYIAEPTQQTLEVAIESVSYAAESIRAYRDTLQSGDEYSAAHNAVFRYFILKRGLEMVETVYALEKSEA